MLLHQAQPTPVRPPPLVNCRHCDLTYLDSLSHACPRCGSPCHNPYPD